MKIKNTLQGTNISHLGKRNNIFKSDLKGDMLVSRRVVKLPPPDLKKMFLGDLQLGGFLKVRAEESAGHSGNFRMQVNPAKALLAPIPLVQTSHRPCENSMPGRTTESSR